ncbi:hypothetical protein ARMGADRAFT_1020601 [Armillaria gallica]|uniref:Uncharacterized protein n=1 Tax=Armillaria gallica TaxID=47427 RepID=A0A2H3CNV9_ARMGA|nr:hypothetical protein ARMGADRAFT_1020601 [Armillaria gallica]
MEYIDGKDFAFLSLYRRPRTYAGAQTSIINTVLYWDTFARVAYPKDFEPRNNIFRRP